MIGISEIATYIPPGRESNLDKLEKFGITAAFIDEKVANINRAAFHRSAFVLNAATHLIFVDLAAQLLLSVWELKAVLVALNLLLALIAAAALALLSGCTLMPDYERPPLPVADHYPEAAPAAASGVATRPIADLDAYKEKLQQFVYRSAFVMKPVLLHAGNPGPMTGSGNWTYLIGRHQPVLIDGSIQRMEIDGYHVANPLGFKGQQITIKMFISYLTEEQKQYWDGVLKILKLNNKGFIASYMCVSNLKAMGGSQSFND